MKILFLLLLIAADPWADGVRAYRQQNWTAAWKHFEVAAAESPVDVDLVWNQALTALQLEKWDACLQLAQSLASSQRRGFLMAEMSWRQSASQVQTLALSSLPLEQVEAKHVRALQSALRHAQRAQALWKGLTKSPDSMEVEEALNVQGKNQRAAAIAQTNHRRAAAKVEQLQQKLKQWQQQLAKKNGSDPPPPPPDKIDPNAPPPPPDQQPKMTMQDQQDLLDKLQNRQKKKVVVRERNAGKTKPGGKDW